MAQDAVRLAQLEIEDFALIARASLNFSDGFTVCSGETGSGKTMLLGALAFVLGGRSSSDIVADGAARARVTLVLQPNQELRLRLGEQGFEAEEGEDAIFVREMLPTGKSMARINGRLATSAQLREAAAHVSEQIGQHEAQRLLARGYHMDVLDAFAGEVALAKRRDTDAAFECLQRAQRELEELRDDATRAAAELEAARFAVTEINDAKLNDGEDVTLRSRRDYLTNVERIAAALGSAHEALSGEGGAALEALGNAAASVTAVASFSPVLESIAATLAAVQSDANDAAVAIARQLDAGDFDVAELESVTARLDIIERLKRKYGGTTAAMRETAARHAATVARESSRDEREAALQCARDAARSGLIAAARELSSLRAGAAHLLEARVAAELAALAMPAARFGVMLEAQPEIGPKGGESVEFALAPNPGEPLRPLARAASGGELSRVLLALVVVLANRRERTALVFDEIDAGIGGATATAVGLRLGLLALGTQVVCVTHLAQIASWADRHYTLRKRQRDANTEIEVVALANEAAVRDEIARMLAGTSSNVALEHAKTLLADARARKARLRSEGEG